jgi:eukaryotic-like serine/threonine-protein kinase
MIGERIGHLRVIASIGVGGMGAVWHAVDELLDRHVALKVIRPELMSRPGLAERFRSEAIVLARLQHPCIAALYGLEKRGDEFVMVMEFVDGETLDTRLAVHGALPWPEATRITRAVLDALDHAHESGVIHRDIKPANVMITRAGRVKVMDFGIARLVGAQRQTRTGAAVGTPSYMSPEQLLGQEVDGRADVYAVGTLLYELTTGHLPFEVEGDYLRMIAQLQQVPPAPSSHIAALPAGLDLIVARALQKEPDDRYATSGEFRDALEELEREHGVLRPYGTPAAGLSTVTGAAGTRGTTSSQQPAPGTQPTPGVVPASSALLTPVESAMSVTPVPFSVDPAGATPIDLTVPTNLAGASPVHEPAPATPAEADAVMRAAAPTPEYTVAPLAPVPEVKRSAMPRVIAAVVAIGVVTLVGVMLTKRVDRSEQLATDASVNAPVAPVATAPVATAPVAPAPAVSSLPAVAAPVATDSVDSTAIRKAAAADSARAARRAQRDSIAKARRDSAVAATPFALPGAPTEAQLKTAREKGIAAIRACRDLLEAQNVAAIETRFGSDNIRNVLRVVRDGRLEVGPTLGASAVVNDQATSVTSTASVLLRLKNDANADRSFRAALRTVTDKQGANWVPTRCLIDSDGGIRP